MHRRRRVVSVQIFVLKQPTVQGPPQLLGVRFEVVHFYSGVDSTTAARQTHTHEEVRRRNVRTKKKKKINKRTTNFMPHIQPSSTLTSTFSICQGMWLGQSLWARNKINPVFCWSMANGLYVVVMVQIKNSNKDIVGCGRLKNKSIMLYVLSIFLSMILHYWIITCIF